jgi:hypothetical protein
LLQRFQTIPMGCCSKPRVGRPAIGGVIYFPVVECRRVVVRQVSGTIEIRRVFEFAVRLNDRRESAVCVHPESCFGAGWGKRKAKQNAARIAVFKIFFVAIIYLRIFFMNK